MADTHQSKLHIDLIKSPHGEPVESVIAFHLAKDRLHFFGAFTAVVLSSPLTGKFHLLSHRAYIEVLLFIVVRFCKRKGLFFCARLSYGSPACCDPKAT